jgi:hypothetical protein
MPRLLEYGPQVRVVEDLAVIGDPQTAVLVRHRLLARSQIHDTEPPMAERSPVVLIEAGIVGPAVADNVRHPLDQGPIRFRRPDGYKTSDSAHGRLPFPDVETFDELAIRRILPAD